MFSKCSLFTNPWTFLNRASSSMSLRGLRKTEYTPFVLKIRSLVEIDISDDFHIPCKMLNIAQVFPFPTVISSSVLPVVLVVLPR